MEPALKAPDVFTKFVNEDIVKWPDLGQRANIKLRPWLGLLVRRSLIAMLFVLLVAVLAVVKAEIVREPLGTPDNDIPTTPTTK